MMIKGVGGATVAPGQSRPVQGGAAFALPAGTSVATPAAPMPAVALDALLLLQESEGAPARDRRARQHGRAMLDALGRLQLSLLEGDVDGDTLASLAALLDDCPDAADPGLRDILGAVALRARLELARHGV